MVDVWYEMTRPLEAMKHSRSSGSLVRKCEQVASASARLLDEIAAMGGNFNERWARVRSFLPLQVRLACEQVMWERGGGWRELVTGFRPVDTGEGLSPSEQAGARSKGTQRVPYLVGATPAEGRPSVAGRTGRPRRRITR